MHIIGCTILHAVSKKTVKKYFSNIIFLMNEQHECSLFNCKKNTLICIGP